MALPRCSATGILAEGRDVSLDRELAAYLPATR